MKTIITFAFSLIIMLNASAKSLDEIATKINAQPSIPQLMEIRANLEQLCTSGDANWLTHYYMVYADLCLFFSSNEEKTKLNYLDDAKAHLAKIADGDPSEVEALRGYWYMALVTTNQAENGPKYSPIVIGCYQKALKINPENPRAILLNAIFMSNMQKSFGGVYKEFNDDMKRAYELLQASATALPNPQWGMEFFGNQQ